VYDVAENRRKKSMKTIDAKEFDRKFDNGEDISEYLNVSQVQKLHQFDKSLQKTKKINVDFPESIVMQLDEAAAKIGVTRQSIIKFWIAERLKEERKTSGL
jgi:predicted DNA binding CopG/RHH family protein